MVSLNVNQLFVAHFLSYFCNPWAICKNCIAWGIKEIAAPR